MITKRKLLAALLSFLTVVAIPAPTQTTLGIPTSSTKSDEAAYPSPTYAFHETIYGTQAKALVGIVMPVLSVLAIIPLGLIYWKRRQEKCLGPNWEIRAPQSYQKAYWSSRYQHLNLELDATQGKIEMAGGREAAEMEADEARFEAEGEDVDDRGRNESSEGDEKMRRRETWRESVQARLGVWRWSRQEPVLKNGTASLLRHRIGLK